MTKYLILTADNENHNPQLYDLFQIYDYEFHLEDDKFYFEILNGADFESMSEALYNLVDGENMPCVIEHGSI